MRLDPDTKKFTFSSSYNIVLNHYFIVGILTWLLSLTQWQNERVAPTFTFITIIAIAAGVIHRRVMPHTLLVNKSHLIAKCMGPAKSIPLDQPFTLSLQNRVATLQFHNTKIKISARHINNISELYELLFLNKHANFESLADNTFRLFTLPQWFLKFKTLCYFCILIVTCLALIGYVSEGTLEGMVLMASIGLPFILFVVFAALIALVRDGAADNEYPHQYPTTQLISRTGLTGKTKYGDTVHIPFDDVQTIEIDTKKTIHDLVVHGPSNRTFHITDREFPIRILAHALQAKKQSIELKLNGTLIDSVTTTNPTENHQLINSQTKP